MAQLQDIPKELVVDRRQQVRNAMKTKDRRKTVSHIDQVPVAKERRKAKVERRRQIDPTTCERDYNDEEVNFMKAMDDYKRRSGRQFPTWSEVLEVLRDLGYRKVADEQTTFESN